MNKKILALTIAATLGLYGCDDTELTGEPTVEQDIARSLAAETRISFDLLADEPTLILPTFLAVDSTNGTLSTDDSSKTGALSDPLVALGKTDGWSTSQPISINFTGSNIDANTVNNAFFLIKTDNPSSSSNIGVQDVLTQADGDFVISVQGSSLNVVLTKPLDPKSDYMFALTDSLKDTNGNSVGMTESYAYLKSKNPTPSTALDKAQEYTHKIEATFATQGIDTSTIIYSSWFTTASVGDVLFATKGAIASALNAIKTDGNANAVWGLNSTANPNNVDTTGLFSFSENVNISAGIPAPYKAGLDAKGLTTYSGKVSIPYFLETSVVNEKWKKTPWQSGMPSLAKISNVLSNGSDADKATVMTQLTAFGVTTEDLAKVSSDLPTQLKVMTALTGKKLTLADGSQLDTAREITRYSPIPQLKSVEKIPYLLIMPDMTNCTGGVPVNIFQHGITSVKENVLALASEAIDNQCQALIAIDHPLHGARALSDGTVTNEANPDVYMNLTYLTVGRDNFRQSISDNMSLRAALGSIFARNAVPDPTVTAPFNLLTPANGSSIGVGYIGHSLGAMTGIGYTATVNKPITDTATENAMFKVNRAQFANPGAGIPYLLMNSTKFGGVVKDSLLSVASTDYQNFKAGFCPSGTNPATCFSNFYANLTDTKKATVNATFSSFAYAAQTVLDTVDPINHVGTVVTTTPSYLTMVVNDEVIPNGLDSTVHSPYSPFGGTLPLIFSGYNQITTTTSNASRAAATFVAGSHSSLLDSTSNGAVTTEMQDQTASFINAGDIAVSVSGSSLLTTIPTP